MSRLKVTLKDYSMKAKILAAFIIISLFTLFVAGISSYYASRSYNEKEAIDSSKQIVYLISSNVDTIIGNIESTWIFLASNDDIINYFENNHTDDKIQNFEREKYLDNTYFKKLLVANNIMSSIICYPGKGHPISSGEVDVSYLKNYEDFDIYKRAMTEGSMFLWRGSHTFEGEYFKSRINGIMSMSRQVRSLESGYILGVIEIQLKEESVYNIFKTLNRINGSGIIIFDSAGNIVTGDQDSRKNPPDYFNGIVSKVIERQDGTFKNYLSGKEYLFNYNTLKNGWKIVHYQPMGNMVNASLKLGRTIFIAGFLIIVLISLLAAFFSESITQPLRQFVSYTEGIREVRYVADSKGKKAGNEIEGLYNNYNNMLRKIKESELDTLKAQITPHFLYNTLNSIKCRAYVDGHGQVAKMTGALIDLLQLSINNRNEYITISDELKMVDSYILLQQSRHEEKFNVTYIIPGEFNDYIVPKMIIQPLVENAILHGLEEIDGDGEIIISTMQQNSDITISVKDNGVGMTPERISQVLNQQIVNNGMKFNRIGLNNVNERIKIYFGDKYGLEIYSAPGSGTDVRIRIPAVKNSEQLAREIKPC